MFETFEGIFSLITSVALLCFILVANRIMKRQQRLGFLKCPQCGQKISGRDWYRFTTRVGSRKAAPCPNCGRALQWAKWPYRVMCGALILAAAIFPTWVIRTWNVSWQARDVSWVEIDPLLTGSAVIAYATLFQRLEPGKDQDEP